MLSSLLRNTSNRLKPMDAPNKNLLDVSQIFQTYLTFGGDVERTALAVGMQPVEVRTLAQSERWADKLSLWNEFQAGDKKELQIQINRAVNYVQAHRLRTIIDKVVTELSAKDGKGLIDLLTEVHSGEKSSSEKFSARALTDLVKGAETCQLMTQRALGDTNGASASDAPTDGSSIALSVMKAMAAADSLGVDSVTVVRKQLANPRLDES